MTMVGSLILEAFRIEEMLTTGAQVGGEQLDMAMGRANMFARFVMCGGISQYNAETKSGPTVSTCNYPGLDVLANAMKQKNFANIIAQRIK